MKHIIIFIFLALLSNQSSSQQRWEHIYGKPNTHEPFRKLLEYYDKGYLLSAYYEDYDGNWLIKTDINGNMLWEKFLFWENTQIVSGTPLQDNMGCMIVASSVWMDQGNWPYLVKLDECGNRLWCRTFIDNDYLYGWFEDALLLDNNDILALGFLKSEEDIDNVFLYYITSEGDLLWKKPYASRTNHPLIRQPICEDIIEFNNEYFISGECYYPYPDTTHFYRRPFVACIDSLYNEKWILPFGIGDSIVGVTKSIIPINDSIYMGVGIIFGDETNSLLMFFNHEGEELDYNRITNSQIGPDIRDNYIFDIARIDDTLFLASASFGEDLMGPNPFGEFVIDTSGQLYNHQTRPNTFARSQIIKTYDDKYAIGVAYDSVYGDQDAMFYKINKNLEQDTTYNGNYTYDSLCTDGIESGIIDITDCLLVVGTDDTPSPSDYYTSLSAIPIVAYPNPAKESITFSLGNTENHTDITMSCYDALGSKIHNEIIYLMQTQTTVDISKWIAGMYIAIVTSEGSTVGQCKFVIR